MSSHQPLVIGNWKMNPQTAVDAKSLVAGLRAKIKKDLPVTVAIAPPFPFLAEVARARGASGLLLAAQDVFFEEQGAFTGEVSPTMLTGFGVTHVIIGHSERRALGETDELVNKKVQAAIRRKLTPVVCVGERERDGTGDYFSFVEAQVRSLVSGLTARQVAGVVMAYEPVWAIGTGKNATPDDVQEMQLFIRSVLTKLYDRATGKRVRIIYGGSVKSDNAKLLHEGGKMGGFLVGGASLKVDEFISIVRSVIV